MKKFLVVVLFLSVIFTSSMCFAGQDIIYYPEDVKEILSATYSSGGGDKVIIYVKVFCLLNNGEYEMYLEKKNSIAGVFGLGRFSIPKKIQFIRKPGLFDKLIWK